MNKLKYLLALTCVMAVGALQSQTPPTPPTPPGAPAAPVQEIKFPAGPALADVPASNFVGLPLVGRWYPYGGGYAGATVAKQGNLCVVQGLIRSGDWATTLALLPEGMRPAQRLIFGQNNHVNSCRIDVYPNGELRWDAGTKDHGWVSLSGMIFSPTQAGTPIQLNISHWAPYGGGHTAPAWIKEGNIVVLCGLAKISSSWSSVNAGDQWNNHGGRLIGILPEGSRPTKRLVFDCDNHGTPTRVDILPDGKIVVVSGGSRGDAPWVSLDGVAFSTVEGTEQALPNSGQWVIYDRGTWGVPTAIRHGNICMLQGLIKPVNNRPTGTWMFRLPENMWPAKRLIFNCMGAGAHARIDINEKGYVYWIAGSATSDWVSLSNIVYAVQDQKLGGKNYTHVERLASYKAYHENWKLGLPGQGWVKFKAKTEQDINVSFSSVPKDLPGATYFVSIGGYDNTRTIIYSGTNLYEINTSAGGNPNAIITDGRPRDGILKIKDGKPEFGQQYVDYWIKVDNGLITFGKGTEVGQGELGRWQDPNPLKFVQYVGFGGWDVAVDYKDIQMSGAPVIEIPVNLPDKFEAEEGKAKRVAVGSLNGELEVWVVGFDNQLWRYDAYSMAPLPWAKQEFKDAAGAVMKFEDVSCASDGTMVAIDDHGKALIYDRTKKAWSPIAPGKGNESLDFEFISAGNKDCIWAVDTEDKDIYELTKDGWVVRADGIGAYVACGVDGTVVALNAKGEAFRYNSGKWFEMSGVLLERVAVGDKDNIFGSTDKDNALWQWKADKWEPVLGKDGKPASGLDEIAVNAAGTFFGADEDGDIYHRGEAGVTVAKPAPAQVQTATTDVSKTINDLIAGKVQLATLAPDIKAIVVDLVPEVAKAKPGEKPAVKTVPTPEQIKKASEKQLTKAKPAKPKKEATRGKAKKEGKVKAKPAKKKTSGKGKAAKKGAKVKKAVKKADKLVKKAQKKADKKKKAAKKTDKKSDKKSAKKDSKKPAKKPAKKSAKK